MGSQSPGYSKDRVVQTPAQALKGLKDGIKAIEKAVDAINIPAHVLHKAEKALKDIPVARDIVGVAGDAFDAVGAGISSTIVMANPVSGVRSATFNMAMSLGERGVDAVGGKGTMKAFAASVTGAQEASFATQQEASPITSAKLPVSNGGPSLK